MGYIIKSLPLLITFNKTWKLTQHQIQDFSPNFLVKKFYLNGPFVQLFEPIAPKSAETARLWKSWYFTSCKMSRTSKDDLFLPYCNSLKANLNISNFVNLFVIFLPLCMVINFLSSKLLQRFFFSSTSRTIVTISFIRISTTHISPTVFRIKKTMF